MISLPWRRRDSRGESVTVAGAACPFCGSSQFEDFRGRKLEKCSKCGSKARDRATWVLLRDFAKVSAESRVLHFAPEQAIAAKLAPLCGENYRRFDIDPARYARHLGLPVERCDLCSDIATLSPPGQIDVVIHNHVLEHVPCNYTIVLQQLHERLKPGGVHIFSFPVQQSYYREDQNPRMSGAERKQRFGQADHVRRFGAFDFEAMVGRIFGLTNDYSIADLVAPEALVAAQVPRARWSVSGKMGPVFAVRKL